MTATVTPTQEDIYTGLKAFLLSLVTTGIIQGLGNRAPTPIGEFIAMTATLQNRLATNISGYNDPGVGAGERSVTQHLRYTVQIDCYGPLSGDWATIISTMWRDSYGCDFLLPFFMQPLYADNPVQMPIVDGEEQYEQRWMVIADLQVNATITTAQEFANAASVNLVNVETTYPL